MSWFSSWSRTQRHAEDVTALQDEAARIRREWSTPSTPQPAPAPLVGTPWLGGVMILPAGLSPQSAVMSLGGTGSLLVSKQAALSQAQKQALLNQQLQIVQQQYALGQGIQQATQNLYAASVGGVGGGGGGYATSTGSPSWFNARNQTMPIDPIYRVPPTAQWRESYVHALDAAKRGREVEEG